MTIENVGAADPELQNSPIAEENDVEYDVLKQEVPGNPACLFNSVSYRHGQYVRSGSGLLRCDYGIWVRSGGSDPDNP